MRFLIICLLISTFTIFGQSIKGDFYAIDTQHSLLDFKIKHIGFGSVRGRFSEYEGTVFYDPSDVTRTSASVVIVSKSIGTGAEGRDGILRDEFFEVEKYPTLKFVSSSVSKKNNQYYLEGDLTIGGVQKKVRFPFIHESGPSEDQFKHSRISFSGNISLNRRDFNIFYRSNKFWDSIIEDSVYIEMEVGARVYNYHDTVFPFRETSIGRMASEAYASGGRQSAEAKIKEVLASKEKFDTSFGQMLRGAGYLYQSGDIKGAISLLDLFIENVSSMDSPTKAEFMARKAQYYLKQGDKNNSKKYANESLTLDNNTLAIEVLKKAVE